VIRYDRTQYSVSQGKMKLVRRVMDEEGIDLWIIFTREGNPDPVA
jgi:hypothetical protein